MDRPIDATPARERAAHRVRDRVDRIRVISPNDRQDAVADPWPVRPARLRHRVRLGEWFADRVTADQVSPRKDTMPTLATIGPYIFRFRSLDYGERPHVHVTGHGGSAKFWLQPIEQVRSRDYHHAELKHIARLIDMHQAEWLAEWEKRSSGN